MLDAEAEMRLLTDQSQAIADFIKNLWRKEFLLDDGELTVGGVDRLRNFITTFAGQQVLESERRVWEEAIKISCALCRAGELVKKDVKYGVSGYRRVVWYVHGEYECVAQEFHRRRAQEGTP